MNSHDKLNDEQIKKVQKLFNEEIVPVDKIEHLNKEFREIFTLIGEDNVYREGIQETPFRFIKAMLEYTKGNRENPKEYLSKKFKVNHNEMVIVKDIEFNSLCEHHLAPFFGVAHIGYIPNGEVVGLSKLARVLEAYANRLQVQEQLTTQVADCLEDELNATGVMVVIEAKHYCMCGRGVKKNTTSTVTSAVRGAFNKEAVRKEFLDLIK